MKIEGLETDIRELVTGFRTEAEAAAILIKHFSFA